MAHKRKVKVASTVSAENSAGEADSPELALLKKGQTFAHAHGSFAAECNEHCGHYVVGQQLTQYNPKTHKLESVAPLKSAERH